MDGDKGGALVATVTGLGEIGNNLRTINDDFKQFESELEPKKNLTNEDIRRVLKDNRTAIKALAKVSRANVDRASRTTNASTSKPNPVTRNTTTKKSKQYYKIELGTYFFRLYLDGRAESTNSFSQRYIGTWSLENLSLIHI